MAEQSIVIGGNGEHPILLAAGMANRHGLITGATGTGKTVTLQVLAEAFSHLGVPVFTADIKGDLSGLAAPGAAHPKIAERLQYIGTADHQFSGSPVIFWDLYGKQGHPIRATISEVGPRLLSNLLDLNETQEGVLEIAFSVADDEGLLLLDLKDLRAILNWLAENPKAVEKEYGLVSKQSIAAILRRLLMLENEEADQFFGEPALRIQDLLLKDGSGQGAISLLDATRLYNSPKTYSTFLLWLLSELMEELPEEGDAELPKLVFFFDEAHLLFNNAPKALTEKIAQVVRLIRSKGVGVFFVTQYPSDIPEEVLGQLGNRIQHALRAFTPKDRKSVKAAAESFRPNPAFDTATVIGELGVGEALVSTLDKKGVPSRVERTLISPPKSKFGPIDATLRSGLIQTSPVLGVYDRAVDRESAHELLLERGAQKIKQREMIAESENAPRSQPKGRSSSRQSVGETFAKSVARAVGSSLGRQIIRGILGAIIGRK